MIVLCEDKFILFTKDKSFNPEDLGLKFLVITPEEVQEKYSKYPILPLDEYLLLNLHKNVTKKLISYGIISLHDITIQVYLISIKESNLPKSVRELVIERYKELWEIFQDA